MILRADEKITGGGLSGLCFLNDPAGKLRHGGTRGKLELQIETIGLGKGFFHDPDAFDPSHGPRAPTQDKTSFLLSPFDKLRQSLRKNPSRYYRDHHKQTSED